MRGRQRHELHSWPNHGMLPSSVLYANVFQVQQFSGEWHTVDQLREYGVMHESEQFCFKQYGVRSDRFSSDARRCHNSATDATAGSTWHMGLGWVMVWYPGVRLNESAHDAMDVVLKQRSAYLLLMIDPHSWTFTAARQLFVWPLTIPQLIHQYRMCSRISTRTYRYATFATRPASAAYPCSDRSQCVHVCLYSRFANFDSLICSTKLTLNYCGSMAAGRSLF